MKRYLNVAFLKIAFTIINETSRHFLSLCSVWKSNTTQTQFQCYYSKSLWIFLPIKCNVMRKRDLHFD